MAPTSDQETLVVSLATGAATDFVPRNSEASNEVTVHYDVVAPVATLSSTSTSSGYTNVSPIPVDLLFAEDVLGFNTGVFFTVVNGAASTSTESPDGSAETTFSTEVCPSNSQSADCFLFRVSRTVNSRNMVLKGYKSHRQTRAWGMTAPLTDR